MTYFIIFHCCFIVFLNLSRLWNLLQAHWCRAVAQNWVTRWHKSFKGQWFEPKRGTLNVMANMKGSYHVASIDQLHPKPTWTFQGIIDHGSGALQALFSSTYVGLWCIGTAIVKHAVVAQAWVDLCYATNQQAVQKSHEFTRLRMQVHLQVQLVLHHLDCQDVMMKFHPTTKCCCCPYNSGMQLWIMSTFGTSSFLLKVSVCNVHKHHRASPAYPPSPPPPPLSRASRAARMASHVNLFLLRNGILAQFDLAIDLVPGMDLRTMPSHPLLPDEKVYPLQFIPKHASCDVTVDPPVA